MKHLQMAAVDLDDYITEHTAGGIFLILEKEEKKIREDPAWEIAAKGQSQSPIDLGGAKQGDTGTLEFHYLESAIRVANTGHSIQMSVEPGSWVEIDGKRFHLKQFHLHSPSEHTVNGEVLGN